ncbi:hypothetical protein Bpfe_010448 [Biomphalaria pfeifferi]|uniref:Uncharacterized protein n=1 Tax=Biomphalaria pfeifferi TaxID=112525 RepID=A0AAD8FE96_BIOPF|nr:hypothetical protein Bpfe_010448 [Biomphalaria pfeifferi]
MIEMQCKRTMTVRWPLANAWRTFFNTIETFYLTISDFYPTLCDFYPTLCDFYQTLCDFYPTICDFYPTLCDLYRISDCKLVQNVYLPVNDFLETHWPLTL